MWLKGAAVPGHLGYHLAPNKAPRQLGRRAGGRGREGDRGTEERGVEKMGESALFFLPSSERVAIETPHLIKICAPPPRALSLSPSAALGPSSCLSSSGHSSSSAVHRRTETRLRLRFVGV